MPSRQPSARVQIEQIVLQRFDVDAGAVSRDEHHHRHDLTVVDRLDLVAIAA
jgi:hypothetical protein